MITEVNQAGTYRKQRKSPRVTLTHEVKSSCKGRSADRTGNQARRLSETESQNAPGTKVRIVRGSTNKGLSRMIEFSCPATRYSHSSKDLLHTPSSYRPTAMSNSTNYNMIS